MKFRFFFFTFSRNDEELSTIQGLSQRLSGKNILVTGGTGTIGSALVKEILKYEPAVIRIYSRDETKQFNLNLNLGDDPRVRFLIGDIREPVRLGTALEGINIVFHAAALKHVPSCEFNPYEAIKTNVLGTQNLINQCIAQDVDLLMGISTDKVINPVGVMGTTKLLAEKLLVAANQAKGSHPTRFACVRFGNVAGARGSVIPLFLEQLHQGLPITVTEPDMTRFIMSIQEAIRLVLKAALYAKNGEIFILPMPSIRIMDVAETIAERYRQRFFKTVEIKIIGARPGEKLHEELICPHELNRVYGIDDLLTVIPDYTALQPEPPYFQPKTPIILSSNEQKPLSTLEILKLVKEVDEFNILGWED